jgi:hypothetical protein
MRIYQDFRKPCDANREFQIISKSSFIDRFLIQNLWMIRTCTQNKICSLSPRAQKSALFFKHGKSTFVAEFLTLHLLAQLSYTVLHPSSACWGDRSGSWTPIAGLCPLPLDAPCHSNIPTGLKCRISS